MAGERHSPMYSGCARFRCAFPGAFVQCPVGTTIEFKVNTRGTARQPSV